MSGYYDQSSCDIEEFNALIARGLDPGEVPNASDVEKNIAIYDAPSLAPALSDPNLRKSLLAEWAKVFGELSGVLVIKGAVKRTEALDEASAIFATIIEEERSSASGGDHFAKAGANDRIWNSLQKLCMRAPDVFARAFANPAIDAVCEAWLGPGYCMTAQVNLVRPGGEAQVAHRDYHLGFMTMDQAAAYPAHMHQLSPALTLQGAIAHCDMPIESGPTKLLPFSQLFAPGYIACQMPNFRDAFEAKHVQLPLQKGDALFFNPAVFHAAGSNRSTDTQRLANLLQIGSPFGRTLEALDRTAMVRAIYPALRSTDLSDQECIAVVNAVAEGYPFPTNLDNDPPVGGLAPESQAAKVLRFLFENRSVADLDAELRALDRKRRP